jgi:hypothetical protein
MLALLNPLTNVGWYLSTSLALRTVCCFDGSFNESHPTLSVTVIT